MGFHWPVVCRIKTESTILSLWGKIRVSEDPYPRIFYAEKCWLMNNNYIQYHEENHSDSHTEQIISSFSGFPQSCSSDSTNIIIKKL